MCGPQQQGTVLYIVCNVLPLYCNVHFLLYCTAREIGRVLLTVPPDPDQLYSTVLYTTYVLYITVVYCTVRNCPYPCSQEFYNTVCYVKYGSIVQYLSAIRPLFLPAHSMYFLFEMTQMCIVCPAKCEAMCQTCQSPLGRLYQNLILLYFDVTLNSQFQMAALSIVNVYFLILYIDTVFELYAKEIYF